MPPQPPTQLRRGVLVRRCSLTKILWALCAIIAVVLILLPVSAPFSLTTKTSATMRPPVPKAEQAVPGTAVPLHVYTIAKETCLPRFNGSVLPVHNHTGVIPPALTDALFQKPPLPIVGTDAASAFSVRAFDVAEFASHLIVWRSIFADSVSNALVLSGVSVPPAAVEAVTEKTLLGVCDAAKARREDWHVLLIDGQNRKERRDVAYDKERAPGVFVRSELAGAVGNVSAYVVSPAGANVLLSHASAFTVPLGAFMAIVPGLRVLKINGYAEAAAEDADCIADRDGPAVSSSDFPYYPPLHALHSAARRANLQL